MELLLYKLFSGAYFVYQCWDVIIGTEFSVGIFWPNLQNIVQQIYESVMTS